MILSRRLFFKCVFIVYMHKKMIKIGSYFALRGSLIFCKLICNENAKQHKMQTPMKTLLYSLPYRKTFRREVMGKFFFNKSKLQGLSERGVKDGTAHRHP